MFTHLVALLMLQQVPGFTVIDHPGSGGQTGDRIRIACRSAEGESPAALRTREMQLASAVDQRGATAATWIDLGCVRAVLSLTNVVSREGPLMVSGTSWSRGSINALLRGLSLAPGDAHGADALALMALSDAQPEPLAPIISAIKLAVASGHVAPAVYRACADLSLRVADTATSRQCATRALTAGYDSTWHLLRLARLSYRAGDSIGGVDYFTRGAGAAHDSLSRGDVDWHLQWFLSPDERKEWTDLPDNLRAKWVRDRLAARDVRDGRPMGARLAEHFRRLEYVEATFPLDVSRKMKEGMRSGPASHLTSLDAITTQRMGDPTLRNMDVNDPNGGDAAAVYALPFRDYSRWQMDFDDRGVVWMRFGAPEKRIPYAAVYPSHTVREAWLYEIDGERMILNFEGEDSGSVGATRLVSGVLGKYLCDIDTWRCVLTMRAESGFSKVPRNLLEQLRQQDREYISVATTKDDNSVRGEKNLKMVAQLYRLWNPVDQQPIAVVSYAIRIGDMSLQKDAAGRTGVVDLALRQWDGVAERESETSQSRHLQFGKDATKDAEATGFMVVPSSPGITSWSLMASQPDNRLGRAWEDSRPPLDTGALTMSDLVLGVAEQNLAWVHPGGKIVLAPLGAMTRKQALTLYFQIKSESAHPDLQATIALYHIDSAYAADTNAVLQVRASANVRAGLNEVERQIDLATLTSGSYRLEVRLSDLAGHVAERRDVRLNVR